MSFCVFNFFQKTNENTSHSSENEFICSIIGRIHGLTICFQNQLIFRQGIQMVIYFPYQMGKIFTFENECFLPFQILLLQKISLLILQPSSFIHSFCIISVAHFAAQLTTRYVWSKISNYTLTAAHTYSKFTRNIQVLIAVFIL